HHRAFDQPVDAAHGRGDLQGRVAHGIGGQLSPAEDAVEVLDLVPVALTVGAERCAVKIVVTDELPGVDAKRQQAGDNRDPDKSSETTAHPMTRQILVVVGGAPRRNLVPEKAHREPYEE